MATLSLLYVPATVTEIGEHAFGYKKSGTTSALVSGFTVYGEAGSAAEEYCRVNGITFVAGNPTNTYKSGSEFLKTDKLVATFDAYDSKNSTIDLAAGRWYAQGNSSIYATLNGGSTWWKARAEGGIGYDMTQSQFGSSYKSVGISFPVSLLNESGYTVQTTLIAFGPSDPTTEDGRAYPTAGKHGNYHADISTFTFGHIRTLQFGGHATASILDTRWFYHKEPWYTHQSDGLGIYTDNSLSGTTSVKVLTVTGAKTSAGAMVASQYINAQKKWDFDSSTSTLYKTYLPLSEGGEFTILAGYPGTVFNVRVYSCVLTGDEILTNHLADILTYNNISLESYGGLFPEQVKDLALAVSAFDLQTPKATIEAALDAALEPKYNVTLNIVYQDENGNTFKTKTVTDLLGTEFTVPSPERSGCYTRDLFVAGKLEEDKTVIVSYRKVPKLASASKIKELVPGVVCWGDSLTAGAGNSNVEVANKNGIDLVALGSSTSGGSYVTVLNTLIKNRTGSMNGTTNCGVGGETSAVIAARAMTETYYLYLGSAVTIGSKGSATINIQQYAPDGRLGILRQGAGNSISPARITGTDSSGKTVTIEGTISASVASGVDIMRCDVSQITYTFTRTDSGTTNVTLPKNAKIETYGSYAYDGQWCVLFIGANGGWNNNVDILIQQQEEMIAAAGCGDKFVIVGLSTGSDSDRAVLEEKMQAKWGNHYFSARDFISSEACYRMLGFSDAVIEADRSAIESGTISASTYLVDSVHLNAAGYAALGNRVFQQLWSLGLFNPLFDYYDSFYE